MSGERWVAGAYALGTWEGGADEPARGGANCSHGCGLGGGGMLRPSPSQPDQVSTRPPLGGTHLRHKALVGRGMAASTHWDEEGPASNTRPSVALTYAASRVPAWTVCG